MLNGAGMIQERQSALSHKIIEVDEIIMDRKKNKVGQSDQRRIKPFRSQKTNNHPN